MLEEVLNSAKTTLLERLASPLFGSFAVAWCAWNYRFLVVLFSDASVTTTFELIDTVAFPTPWSVAVKGFFLPMISTLVYVFVYPYPAKLVYGFTRRRQKEINQLRQQIEDETLMTKEESRAFRLEYLERERLWKERLDGLVTENETLKAALQPAPKEIAEAPKSPEPEKMPRKEVLPSQLEILKLLGQKGVPVEEQWLLGAISGQRLQKDFDLGELQGRKLIRRDGLNDTYQITHEGRRLLLDEPNGTAG